MLQRHIPVLVLTGGPCGGKTTVLSFLQQKLTDLGFYVITVSEAATEFILSGLKPGVLKIPVFQRQILKYIIEKENRWKTAAELMLIEKIVIICDRGVADAAAYTSPHEFDMMLGNLGYNIVELRDKRYDAVIFLRSVAVDAPDVYTCLNNNARRESVEEACTLDARTLEAWTGHPHLRVIDNSTGIEEKCARVLQSACRVLGIPAPLEIERKYLVSQCDLNLLPRPVQQVNIVQYYLQSEKEGDVERIRARGQSGGHTYYHTIKQFVRPGVRNEVERQITRDEYFTFLKRADPSFGKIDKTRYCFVWENQYFELDSFRNPPGLTLLELELTEEHDKFTLPDFLQGYLTDVTDDPQFSNYEIARRIAS
ncbi:AAA family ATPase [Patescibacteria group bacterium]|nr:AAA family ATPase [Patescibacteria group bacterium]